jgi:hypothetical protein
MKLGPYNICYMTANFVLARVQSMATKRVTSGPKATIGRLFVLVLSSAFYTF